MVTLADVPAIYIAGMRSYIRVFKSQSWGMSCEGLTAATGIADVKITAVSVWISE